MRHSLRLAVTSILVGALLSACGSGGGGSDATAAASDASSGLDAFAEARKKPKPDPTPPPEEPVPPPPEPTPPPPEPTPPPPEPTPPPPEPTPPPPEEPAPAPTNAITWGWLVQAAANSSGGIVKTAGANWYGAGTSMQTLGADGALEFRVNDVGVNPTVNASRVCLDSGVYDVNVAGSLDYCIVAGAGYASVYVRGAWSSDTPITATDTLGIAIEGTSIGFRKNGAVFYTTVDAPSFPLAAVWMTNFDGYGLTSATLTQTGVSAPPPPPPPVAPVGAAATVSWQAVIERTDGSTPSHVTAYRIFYGQDAENLDQWVDIGDPALLSAQFSGMAAGTWYFQVVAIDTGGLESAPSDLLSYEFR